MWQSLATADLHGVDKIYGGGDSHMTRIFAIALAALLIAASLNSASAAPSDAQLAQAGTPTPVTGVDLAVAMTAGVNSSSSPASIIYSLTVTNHGTVAAGATSLTMGVPAGTQLSFAGTPCTSDGATFTCPVPALASQQSMSFTLAVVMTGTQSSITATATVDPAGLVAEANETNNSASATVTITATPTPTQTALTVTPTATATALILTATPTTTVIGGILPDLVATVSESATGSVGLNQTILYTLTVQNAGNATSGATSVNLTIPSGTTLQSVGTCTFTGAGASCPVTALAPQQTATFTVGVNTVAAVASVDATAYVDPNNMVVESNENNNVASTIGSGYYGYPGQPGYPGYSGYPGQPGYPGYNGSPNYGGVPGLSGYPAGSDPYSTSTYSSPLNSTPTTIPYAAPPLMIETPVPQAALPPQISSPGSSFVGPQAPISAAPAPAPQTAQAGYPWLQIVSATQAYSTTMDPLWVAQPGENYYVLRTEGDWALAAWEGNSPFWSVWIQLDSKVRQTTLNRQPPTNVGQIWVTIFGPTQTYGMENQPMWEAQAGDWYRVITQDGNWVFAYWENDPPEAAVWIPLDAPVELTSLEAPGPSGVI